MPMPATDAQGNVEDDPMCPAEVECKPDSDLYTQSSSRVSRWEEPSKR